MKPHRLFVSEQITLFVLNILFRRFKLHFYILLFEHFLQSQTERLMQEELGIYFWIYMEMKCHLQ